MGILYDQTTGYWTCKIRDEGGKDRRHKLRKIQAGEERRLVPDDVMVLAASYETQKPVHPLKTPVAVSAASPTTPTTASTAPQATPLNWWLDRYLTRYRRDHRPLSIRRMEFLVSLLKRFASHNNITTLNEFTAEVVGDFIDWRYQQKDKDLRKQVSKSTMVSELGVISGIFSSAVKVDRLVKNPISLALKEERAGLVKSNIPKFLNPEQVTEFMGKLDDYERAGRIPHDIADLARVMLFTGIRLNAAMHMEYGWIAPQWLVKIPSVMDKAKTGYDAVVVGVGREVVERRRLASGGTGRVFPGLDRKSRVQYHLRKLGIHPHQLRHSFATACVDSGIPMQLIMEMLGQHDLKTTAIYAKVRDNAKVAAASSIRFGLQ